MITLRVTHRTGRIKYNWTWRSYAIYLASELENEPCMSVFHLAIEAQPVRWVSEALAVAHSQGRAGEQ